MNRPSEFFSGKSVLLTLLFAGISFAGILHHEIWLDEAHHWLLARDSHSVSELVHNCRYEGHPVLWNLLLYFIPGITSGVFAMQMLNLTFAAVAVFLLLRFSPFSALEKLLLVFSYFIFYEYTIIARNYSLAFLLLVIVCILYKNRHERFFLFCLALAFLAQTHLFAAVISSGIFLLTLSEKYKQNKENHSRAVFWSGIVVMMISIALVICQAIPPSDHFLYRYDTDALLSFKRIGKGGSVLWKGLFPLPDFTGAYPWNSNLVIGFSKKLAIIPILIAWLIPAILLHRRKTMLFFFYLTAFVLAGFMYASPLIVASRHCGFLFLLLLAAMWISRNYPPDDFPENNFLKRFRTFSATAAQSLFIFILVIQLISSAYLFITDWNRPFSNAKAVAAWINSNCAKNEIVVISDHSAGPAVCAYLGRDVYYPENNAMGSFCKWNTQPFVISRDTLLQRLSQLLDKNPGQPVILVRNNFSAEQMATGHYRSYNFSCRMLKGFGGAMVKAEDYTVYEIKRP